MKSNNINEEESNDNNCNVCVENFNKSTRQCITCPTCFFKQCKECVRRYLLNTNQDPHCMSCKVEWKRDFLFQILPKTFLSGEYKRHREDVLYDKEKSYIIESIPYAEKEATEEKLHKEMDELQNELDKLELRFYCDMAGIEYDELMVRADLKNINKKCPEKGCCGWKKSTIAKKNKSDTCTEKRCDACTEKREVYVNSKTKLDIICNEYIGFKYNGEHKVVEKKEFVKKCPVNDCNGFLSTQWKCGLCENWVCPDCFETKGKERDCGHTCNPDILESAKLLKKETKSCPKCSALIFKIDGCSQIWCTQCHTAFDFNTGKIETRIHNPHYYEYLNKINSGNVPREPGDIPCGGLPHEHDLIRFLNSKTSPFYSFPKDIRGRVVQFYRQIVDVQVIELERNLRINNAQDVEVNRDLRIKFILKKIDEKSFKQTVQQREKKSEKKKSTRSIFETLSSVGTDILQKTLQIITKE